MVESLEGQTERVQALIPGSQVHLGGEVFSVHIPHISLCTDNAAMIAAAGYQHLARGEQDALDFDVLPTWYLTPAA